MGVQRLLYTTPFCESYNTSPLTIFRSNHSAASFPESSAKQTRLDDGTGVGSDTRPQVGTLLGDGSGDGGSLHLSLGVDDDTAVRNDRDAVRRMS